MRSNDPDYVSKRVGKQEEEGTEMTAPNVDDPVLPFYDLIERPHARFGASCLVERGKPCIAVFEIALNNFRRRCA